MKSIYFYICVLIAIIILFICGCSGEVREGENDFVIYDEDIDIFDIVIVDTIPKDTGKDCLFPCNSDEVCINGECVLIQDIISSDIIKDNSFDGDVRDIYYYADVVDDMDDIRDVYVVEDTGSGDIINIGDGGIVCPFGICKDAGVDAGVDRPLCSDMNKNCEYYCIDKTTVSDCEYNNTKKCYESVPVRCQTYGIPDKFGCVEGYSGGIKFAWCGCFDTRKTLCGFTKVGYVEYDCINLKNPFWCIPERDRCGTCDNICPSDKPYCHYGVCSEKCGN